MRSIVAQVRQDIQTAKKIWLPWRVLLPFAALCILVFVIFDHYGRLNLALPALMSVTVLVLLIHLKWSLRRQPFFWAVIAVLTAIHIAVILSVPLTSRWVPALITAAICVVDLCVMLWTLAVVEAWLED